MKRILIAALVGALMFSVAVSAGWKFGAQQGVDVGLGRYPLDLYVGWDFDAPYIDMGPISVAGDFVVTRSYDWAVSALSGALGFDGELTFGYLDDADLIFTSSADIDYATMPTAVSLTALGFGVEIVGYINQVLTLNAGVVFEYVTNLPGPAGPGFNTSFFAGFDAEW